MNNPLKLIITVVISELAGIIGSLFTASAITTWYATIIKPAFNPPSWIFGPVWTTLYALMGISAFLIWREYDKLTLSEVEGLVIQRKRQIKIALCIFISQLVLNTFWSIIFFGLHSPACAFVEIIFLWLVILATIIAFAKISKPAAWLLIPYILWVSFAGYLNYSIWRLNPPAESEQIFCTQEAKQCPDGSYVGRTGPKCEFSTCPLTNDDLWKSTTDSKTGATFKYPETLLTKYIHPVDWPPQIRVLNEQFTCQEAGSEIARAGQTVRRRVDDRVYCVTKESEGAAGSIYTNYAYAFPWYSTGSTQADRRTVIFTFSLRSVQCANYDDPQKTACENERASFDIDGIVDRIARSVEYQ